LVEGVPEAGYHDEAINKATPGKMGLVVPNDLMGPDECRCIVA
jgi:hypothetical protein